MKPSGSSSLHLAIFPLV
ncbi:hypothetical protein MTR67_018165 [Solanum verrucosum]|uniref:Uncharacterized protein n=1 Tax=Solanum verrucosum TaxID=315347 RepID=A0AAF0QP96_SOLVR|nr:hypothetical protein MTR67_018165 [Solanum verrucosum]